MKRRSSTISALAFLLVTATCQAQSARRWEFDRTADLQGWTVPAEERGVVMGGSLWLTLASTEMKLSKDGETAVLAMSPADLHIRAEEANQIRMRVLNLSSLTDFFLRWRTQETGWGENPRWDFEKGNLDWGQPEQSRRCTMKPDAKEWQEITCYIDGRWKGTLEQFAILSAHDKLRGDLWIHSIEIGTGPPAPPRARPNVASDGVIPKITIPGISQTGFAAAFRVLDDCLIIDVPVFGFNYPVMSPGGWYKKGGWWQLDSSLAVTAAKWVNPRFAEDVMRGFLEVQALNPDGRITLMGRNGDLGQVGSASSLPEFFDVAYAVARRTPDTGLRGQIYESMRKYLDWWLSPVKRDERTGLISAVFEETFDDPSYGANSGDSGGTTRGTLAPVDLNVMVAIGAARTAELASALGDAQRASHYRAVFEELSQAINIYLWDDSAGAYFGYDFEKRKRISILMVSTFYPMRLEIAPPGRRKQLLKRLLDPAQFNWGKVPLTSWALTEPGFNEFKGRIGYSWAGNVWTERNMPVISGLEDSGQSGLAAELNWATIREFHAKYSENLVPSTGKPAGQSGYAWTASQYVGAIIEHLFGIDYDAIDQRVRIAPHIPRALYGKDLELDKLILPTGNDTRLSVWIKQSSPTAAAVRVEIIGAVPQGELLAILPGTSKEYRVPLQRSCTANFK